MSPLKKLYFYGAEIVTEQQRVALVTGGSRGIGRATSLKLAETGIDLIITYRSDHSAATSVLEEIHKAGRSAIALQLDLGEVAKMGQFVGELREGLFATWRRDTFDFLVNNGGSGAGSPFAQTTEDTFDAMMNVHFKGVFFLTQKLVPLLADGGSIVNVSTGLTRFVAPASAAYASMKGAVEVLTRHLAAELGDRGITVNTVAPGPTATDFGGGMLRHPEVQQRLAAHNVLGRMGESDDIGGAIAALLSEGNRWVTAQRIEVSGGSHI